MKPLFGALIAATIVTPVLADESDPQWIFQMFDKFAIAQVIGESCSQPSPTESEAYAARFLQIGSLAERQAYVLNPKLAPGQFAEFSARHRHALQSGAKRFLEDHGCEAPDALAMIKDYRSFLAMDLPDSLPR